MHHFTTLLLEWFAQNSRSLPWRETNDPYAIWLSEIILQQTRVQQGMDYWYRFMRRWPDIESLARSSEDEVLRMWQGLGYYSRARHLHAAARQIASMSHFPDTYCEIRQLKGVGDYTAAAVASMAFGLPAAAVDGNVYRVLSRHFGIATPINSTAGKHEFTQLAQALLPPDAPSAFNQAMMDFGAVQCTPQSPACLVCPLAETCAALRAGRVGDLPVKLRKLQVRERRLAYLYLRCKGEVAIRRRGEGDIWAGLWEFVALADRQPRETWMQGATLLARDVRHVLTHRILLADFYFLEVDSKPVLPEGYVWVRESALDDYGKPRLMEKLLEML